MFASLLAIHNIFVYDYLLLQDNAALPTFPPSTASITTAHLDIPQTATGEAAIQPAPIPASTSATLTAEEHLPPPPPPPSSPLPPTVRQQLHF